VHVQPASIRSWAGPPPSGPATAQAVAAAPTNQPGNAGVAMAGSLIVGRLRSSSRQWAWRSAPDPSRGCFPLLEPVLPPSSARHLHRAHPAEVDGVRPGSAPGTTVASGHHTADGEAPRTRLRTGRVAPRRPPTIPEASSSLPPAIDHRSAPSPPVQALLDIEELFVESPRFTSEIISAIARFRASATKAAIPGRCLEFVRPSAGGVQPVRPANPALLGPPYRKPLSPARVGLSVGVDGRHSMPAWRKL